MKYFITGASGLLGGNLVRYLFEIKAGELKVLVRSNSKTLSLDGIKAERAEGDIRDLNSVFSALKGCDYVFHCAASTSQWRPNYSMMYEVNVKGTINIMRASLEAGVKRVVYVSTVDTLGLSSRENPADENWEHDSMAKFRNPYVDTKYLAEQEAKKFLSEGLDIVIVKPTYMIGEWDTKPSSGQMIIQIAKGRVIGYPDGGNNFVDVLDVCKGMVLALERGRKGEAYILGNEQGNLTYKEFFSLVAKIVKVPAPKFRIPYSIAIGMGYLFDIAGRIFRFEPDINSITAKMGYADHYFSSKKAISEIGYSNSEIEFAVKRAYDWFKKYGYL